MALFDDASLVVTPNGYKAGTLYSIKPTSGAGDMTVVRATTATRVNSAGLIESMANNVPRLDYSNGSCPSLLVEPQRTNLLTYSEQFNNGVWGLFSSGTGVNPIITANTTTAPNGTLTADTIVFNSGVGTTAADQSQMYQTFQRATGVTYTYSFYAKGLVGGEQVMVRHADGSSYTKLTLTNDWARYQVTETSAATGTGYLEMVIRRGLNEPMNASATFYIWGAQLEEGAYPTSYIPTTSAAVTRNADAIYKTGINSLIGQTEGVMFLDLFASAKNNDANTFGTWIFAGSAAENFQIYNLGTTLYWYARNTGGIIIDQTANQTIVEGTRYKIAYAYKSGDYALYINGVQKRTSANANVPVAVSQFNLSAGTNGASPVIVKNEYNSVVLFPTRLTNAELATLTTI